MTFSSNRPSPPTRRQGVKQRSGGPMGASAPAGTPSPSWREALKRSCLDRARKNRREAILRSRGLSPSSGDGGGNAGALSFTPLKSAISGIGIAPVQQDDAKILVEEELRAKGVSVFSTPQPGGEGSIPHYGAAEALFSSQQIGGGGDGSMVDHNDHGYEYSISMDEVYGLLKDVEEEMQREEARLLEELKAMEQQQILEQRRMEEQIADFEQHSTMQMQQQYQHPAVSTGNTVTTGSSDTLTCPVCNAGNLIRTPANVIICPNTDNGQCNLRLDVTCEGLSLANLRELLCRACSEHGATGCTGTLRFRSADQFGMTTLMAGCETCNASTMIV